MCQWFKWIKNECIKSYLLSPGLWLSLVHHWLTYRLRMLLRPVLLMNTSYFFQMLRHFLFLLLQHRNISLSFLYDLVMARFKLWLDNKKSGSLCMVSCEQRDEHYFRNNINSKFCLWMQNCAHFRRIIVLSLTWFYSWESNGTYPW